MPGIRFEGRPAEVIGGAIRDSGLVARGETGLVMVSGGADSTTLLVGLVQELGAEALVAFHVNYGLRPEADDDEALVRELCERLGVELETRRAGAPGGNVQAWAREIRHREAGLIRRERGLDWIAVGHTRTDQAETFIYRLVTSPGVRPLLAMPERSGDLVRPLLALDRATVRQLAEVARIPFVDDPTNESLAFARNRIRHQVMPVLDRVNPAAELNVSRTRAELEEDEELLVALADETLAEATIDAPPGFPVALLQEWHPALRRRILRRLAESSLGRPVAMPPGLAAKATRLAADPEGGSLDLGQGGRLLIEAGRVRVVSAVDETDLEPVRLAVEPGQVSFGDWLIAAGQITADAAREAFGDGWSAFLDLDGLPPEGLVVRQRRSGDRIEPLGMDGSRSIQDVFTDQRAPRSRRHGWPVVEAGGKVVWLPGLAVSRHFLVDDETIRVIRLQATPPFSP